MPAGWKPSNDQMASGREEVLWRNEITQGIFKKKVVEVQTITNYRILRNDYGVMLKDIDDAVVLNQHRVSQSDYMGTYYAPTSQTFYCLDDCTFILLIQTRCKLV